MSKGSAVVTLPSDTEILITREFDAPRHLVWRTWTTPELVKRWWAGQRGTVTVADIDLRVGGTWRWVIMTDRGFEVAFHGTYQEIVPNERLVYTEIYEGAPPVPEGAAGDVVNVLTFTDQGGRTLVSSLTRTPSKFVRDMIIGSGMEAGMQEAYDLLEQVAQSLA